MYSIVATSRYRKDLRKIAASGVDLTDLKRVINLPAAGEVLPQKYRDHQLKGAFNTYRECHIESDWLLIYKIDKKVLILTLVRSGTHSDLFG